MLKTCKFKAEANTKLKLRGQGIPPKLDIKNGIVVGFTEKKSRSALLGGNLSKSLAVPND